MTDPGWSTPIQVDRDDVRTTVFPWLVAGGEPGRVAVAFYGTPTDGDPNPGSFKASWDVYVNQSLNALDADPAISQVKATTHPFHYDSVCLQGLNCDLSTPAGDRSLGDFFAITRNPTDGRLSVVFSRTNKKPDDATGRIATPMVTTQLAGPANGGGDVPPRPDREVVRTSSDDPAGDALVNYSNLNVTPPQVSPATPAPDGEPALDFRSQSVGDEIDPATGAKVPDGGFTVTLKLASLSNADLAQALGDASSGSLIYAFRFSNGYTDSAAVAKYDGSSFTFGFNDYTTGSVQCGSMSDKCVIYPGDKTIKGKVDQAAGTITLSVPRAMLRALTGPAGAGQRPAETRAVPGSRFYDGEAFSFANVSPDPATQSFMTPADNAPAMDFLLPGTPPAPRRVRGPAEERPVAERPAVAGPAVAARARRPPPRRRPRPRRRGPGRPPASARSASAPPERSRAARASSSTSPRARPSRSASTSTGSPTDGGSSTRSSWPASRTARAPSAWNGKANRKHVKVTDDYYFVRYRVGYAGNRTDVRRVPLRRVDGRFTVRPGYFRRASCGVLGFFKLERAVFGGTNKRSLRATYRVLGDATVTATILRGKTVVRRFKAVRAKAGRNTRISLSPARLRRGDYAVRLQVKRGATSTTATLTSRRL